MCAVGGPVGAKLNSAHRGHLRLVSAVKARQKWATQRGDSGELTHVAGLTTVGAAPLKGERGISD